MMGNVIQSLELAPVQQMLKENSVKMDVRKVYSEYDAKEGVTAIVQDAEDSQELVSATLDVTEDVAIDVS